MQQKKSATPGRASSTKRSAKSPPASSYDAPNFPPISIASHRALAAAQNEIFARFNANPELASLLLVNPVLAFKEVGVRLSHKMAHHVMQTLRHPTRVNQREAELVQQLQAALGEKPRPTDPAWVSQFLFEKLQLKPLATQGHTPAYKDPLDAATLERLQTLRPKLRRGTDTGPLASTGMTIRIVGRSSALRRMDLDGPAPQLKSASDTPELVDLETLYFYKDLDPLVRDVLELGILQRSAFPIRTGSSYRKIKSGKQTNIFRTWITGVNFPEEPHEPDRQL